MTFYNARTVAEYFLHKARCQSQPLTHLRLQKLLYFSQGWRLAIENRPLLDEPVRVGPFGPVIDSLFAQLIAYRGHDLAGALAPYPPALGQLSADTRRLLEKVWEV